MAQMAKRLLCRHTLLLLLPRSQQPLYPLLYLPLLLLPDKLRLLQVAIHMELTCTFFSHTTQPCLTGNSYCINGAGDEVLVSLTATATGEAPAQYTACHAHGNEQ